MSAVSSRRNLALNAVELGSVFSSVALTPRQPCTLTLHNAQLAPVSIRARFPAGMVEPNFTKSWQS